MEHGFVYLVAVIDWFSRKVLSWRVPNSLTAEFCVEAFEEAITRYRKSEIFNTDQGSQFRRCRLRQFSRNTTSGSAWTGVAPGATTCSSNGLGREKLSRNVGPPLRNQRR